MKRRVAVEYAEAAPEVRAVYDEAMLVMGIATVPNWMKAMGTNAAVLKATWEKFRHVVLEGSVPPLLKQLILFVISINVGNRYCTAAHGHAAMALDKTLSYEDLFSLAEGEASAHLPRAFQVAIEVVTRAALEPKDFAADEVDFVERLKQVGFGEEEIDELMAQADFGVMMNIITDIWHIPADKEFPAGREQACVEEA